MTEIFAHELAAVCRYQGHDEGRFGIPDGTLVVVTPTDYDDEKVTVHATLPDLADPQCSAYLTDIGPTLADIEIVARDAPPWGMTVAPDADVAAVVAAAEARERRNAEKMNDIDVMEALGVLFHHQITVEQYAAALASASVDDDSDPS